MTIENSLELIEPTNSANKISLIWFMFPPVVTLDQ
jgi:hypothetical protein